MYRPATILGSLVALVAAAGLFFTGDVQGKLMFDQQPMKMASAESLCHTETDPDFSILTVGTHNNCDSVTHVIEVPYVLPFLAEGKFTGVTLQGVKDLQQQYEQKFGPGDYRPNLFVTYWAFRAMIGLLGGPSGCSRCRHCGSPAAAGSPTSAGSAGSRCSPCRRRSWPTAPAGCSPRWAASHGWWCPIRPATRWCG